MSLVGAQSNLSYKLKNERRRQQCVAHLHRIIWSLSARSTKLKKEKAEKRDTQFSKRASSGGGIQGYGCRNRCSEEGGFERARNAPRRQRRQESHVSFSAGHEAPGVADAFEPFPLPLCGLGFECFHAGNEAPISRADAFDVRGPVVGTGLRRNWTADTQCARRSWRDLGDKSELTIFAACNVSAGAIIPEFWHRTARGHCSRLLLPEAG